MVAYVDALLAPLVADAGADVHVGVVLSHMGAAFPHPMCEPPGFDGVLREWPTYDAPASCPSSVGRFQTPRSPEDVPPAAGALRCPLAVDSDWCFAQSLEAALKAVTPSTSPIRFHHGGGGHADGENAGFLRDGGVLALLFVGTFDDCSFFDPDMLVQCEDERFCCEERLHPVERYVEGLRVLGRPVVVSMIAGIPYGAEPAAGSGAEIRALLDLPEMRRDYWAPYRRSMCASYPIEGLCRACGWSGWPPSFRASCDRCATSVRTAPERDSC